jgi:dethiobiotin synthetase
MSRGFFITGTDTGIGKTRIAQGIMAALQNTGLTVAAMKPVSAGCEQTSAGLRNDDALQLMRQASIKLPYDLVNPYAFAPPIAPHIAADISGTEMKLEVIHCAYREIADQADIVIVEGAGGWLVPFTQSQTLADLAQALQLPVIMVVGLRLGCLNHALLTAESIRAHGLHLAGWVANRIDPDMPHAAENIATLRRHMPAPLLGEVGFAPLASVQAVAGVLDISALAGLMDTGA